MSKTVIDYTQHEPPADIDEKSPMGDTAAFVYTDSIGRQLREYICTEPDPFMTKCPNWCSIPHRFSAADDRIHQSDRHVVVTELDRAELCATGPATFVPASADLYLMQHYREVEPTIWLGKGESATGFRLTLTEATTLVTTLSRLVAQVQS